MGSMADFTITVHEGRKPMAVRVVVHENLAAMRKAAQMHYNNWQDPRRKSEQPDLEQILGVCHRFHMADDPVFAVVRLATPHLGAGIVAHELFHAVTHLWAVQTKWDEKQPLTPENDEWAAWVLGELVRCTHNKLWEHGLYS